jgi:hypothetical protein
MVETGYNILLGDGLLKARRTLRALRSVIGVDHTDLDPHWPSAALPLQHTTDSPRIHNPSEGAAEARSVKHRLPLLFDRSCRASRLSRPQLAGAVFLASLIMRRFWLPYLRIPGNIGKLTYAKALKYSTSCGWGRNAVNPQSALSMPMTPSFK